MDFLWYNYGSAFLVARVVICKKVIIRNSIGKTLETLLNLILATILHRQHIIWLKCQRHVHEIKTGET